MVIKGINNNIGSGRINKVPEIRKNSSDFKTIFEKTMALEKGQLNNMSQNSKAGLVMRSEKLIDLLQEFADGLMDPSKKLEELNPVVEEIKRESSSLKQKTEGRVKLDGELEDVINRLTMEAELSVFRFKRGDYI